MTSYMGESNDHFSVAKNAGIGVEPLVGMPPTASDQDPAAVIRYIRQLHASEVLINSPALDQVIYGESIVLHERVMRKAMDHEEIEDRYPGDLPWFGTIETIWTPYDMTRGMLRALKLQDTDTFYDLGSGYGRVSLYAGMVSTANCKGIELVDERSQFAEEARRRLQLDSVELIRGNVLGVDFSDGNVFYMWHPFSRTTFERVMDKLRVVAEQRADAGQGPITVVTRGQSSEVSKQPWLERYKKLDVTFAEHTDVRSMGSIVIYKSLPGEPTQLAA